MDDEASVLQRENEAMKLTLSMIANTAHNMVCSDRIIASEARQQFAGINTLAEPWSFSVLTDKADEIVKSISPWCDPRFKNEIRERIEDVLKGAKRS